MKPKRFQMIFKTNADYDKTMEQLTTNPHVERWHVTDKGLLQIYPKTSEQTIIQLSRYGKVNLFYYSTTTELELYEVAPKILKDEDGNEPKIKDMYWKTNDEIMEAYFQLTR